MRLADLIRRNITRAKQEEDEQLQKQRLQQQQQQQQQRHGTNDDASPSNSNNTINPKEEGELQLSFQFPGPPGLVEGVATGLFVLGVLTPVRSVLVQRFLSSPSKSGSSSISSSSVSLGFLPEFILTSSQMLLSAQAALYMGSLFGSYHYLHQLASMQDPATATSRTADSICQDALVTRLLLMKQQNQEQNQDRLLRTTSSSFAAVPNNVNIVSSSSSSSSSSSNMMMMNPNQHVLLEFQKALDTCQVRNSFLRQQQQQQQQSR
jgi:hypothetical protein